MACKCGSQIVLCNLPVRFDTYVGCTHGCRYCFVQKKNGQLEAVSKGDDVRSLKLLSRASAPAKPGGATGTSPSTGGGMSDPFQPVEKKYRYSLECLKLLAETRYPFVVSTKGRLVADPEYLDLLERCNCVGVVQISMVCSKYDCLEHGTPDLRRAPADSKNCFAQGAADHRPHPALYARGAERCPRQPPAGG